MMGTQKTTTGPSTCRTAACGDGSVGPTCGAAMKGTRLVTTATRRPRLPCRTAATHAAGTVESRARVCASVTSPRRAAWGRWQMVVNRSVMRAVRRTQMVIGSSKSVTTATPTTTTGAHRTVLKSAAATGSGRAMKVVMTATTTIRRLSECLPGGALWRWGGAQRSGAGSRRLRDLR